MFCLWMAVIVGEFSGMLITIAKIIINDGNYIYLCLTCKSTIVLCVEAFFSPRVIVSFPKEEN